MPLQKNPFTRLKGEKLDVAVQNLGAGKVPGEISLVNKTTGVTYGPWQATGIAAPTGEKNVNWQVLLNPRIG